MQDKPSEEKTGWRMGSHAPKDSQCKKDHQHRSIRLPRLNESDEDESWDKPTEHNPNGLGEDPFGV
jgi:hypothetical protein